MSAEWLEPFVRETVDSYRQFRAKYAADANDLLEQVQRLLQELSVTPQFAGFLGEQWVNRRLQELKYAAVRSPGSRSPADVWGFQQWQNGIAHFALFQVKTASLATYK
jgi:hypothetical protein